MRKLISVCTVLLGASLLGFGAEVPRTAGELSFHATDGKPVDLAAFKGKVVALEFILTTCPHCQAAAKVMNQMQSQFAHQGFQAIDIALNQGADKLVNDFKKNFGVGFPVGYADPYTALRFLGLTPQRLLFPQLVLIDRQGRIQYQSPVTGDELVADPVALRAKIQVVLKSGKSPASNAYR